MRKIFVVFIALVLAGVGCVTTKEKQKINLFNFHKNMLIASPAFKEGENVPKLFTCDGSDINPELIIKETPAATKSLVLIVDDPDSPSGTWAHWLIWNIDPGTTSIKENSVPAGAIQGTTSFGKPGYGGPCPHSGQHHYVFKIYALDVKLDLSVSANETELERAMNGHILDQAQLVGLYQR